MKSAFQLGAALEEPSPPASPQDAGQLAQRHFGMSGTCIPLHGERDRNFHLRTADGAEFVLKIAHPGENPAVLDLQDQALRHIALQDPALPVPRVVGPAIVWSLPGKAPRVVRMLTYLSGRPVGDVDSGPAQLRTTGECLARLDRALADFRHPAEDHDLVWDLQRAARVRGLLGSLPESRARLPLLFLDRFEARIEPLLASLPKQLIHNDFNPSNILASGDGAPVRGIIDFGDMVRAPRIQDLATAAAYQISGPGHPLERATAIAAAYHSTWPLQQAEWTILPGLIATRLVLTIAISSWRAQRDTDNAGYILRNQGRAWSGLERLAELSEAELRDAMRPAPPHGEF